MWLLRRDGRRRGCALDGGDNALRASRRQRLLTSVASCVWPGRGPGEAAALGLEGVLVLPGDLNRLRNKTRRLGPWKIKLLLSVGKAVLENKAYLGFLLGKPESEGLATRFQAARESPTPPLSSEHTGPQIAGLRRDSLLPDGSPFSLWGPQWGLAPLQGGLVKRQECSGSGSLSLWKEIIGVDGPCRYGISGALSAGSC